MSQVSSDFGDEGFGDALEEMPADDMGGVEQPTAPPAPMYRPQSFSIYSVMLILAFVFLLIAMILFFQEAGRLQN